MKWAGVEYVSVAQINVTDDVRARRQAAHVAELAESMRDVTGGEPGNPLWLAPVDHGRYDVVAGRDRLAAALLLKSTHVPARIIGEHTRAELIKAEAHENLRRRNVDRSAELAKMTRELEAELIVAKAEQARQGGTRVPPSQDIRGEARAAVARAAGVTPAAVRKAEQRVKAREEGAAQATPGTSPPAPSPPPIETWGAPYEPMRALVQPVLDALDAADRHMRAAQGALKEPGVMDHGVAARLYEDAHRLATNVRAARPAALCPWCKWDTSVGTGYVTSCLGCHGLGWVTAEVLEAAPEDLRAAGVYAVAGEFLGLEQAKRAWAKACRRAGGPPGVLAPAKRGMSVEWPDGFVGTPSESEEHARELTVERDVPDEEIPF